MALSRSARHGLAVACAVAWLVCPTIEPAPNGPEPTRLDWLVAVDLFAVGGIVVAVAMLWRGSRLAARAGVLAAAGMAAETVLCPVTGHHATGWWTWTQWGMTAFVLVTSIAVGVLQRGEQIVPPAGGQARSADVVATGHPWRLRRPRPTHPAGSRPARDGAYDRRSRTRVR